MRSCVVAAGRSDEGSGPVTAVVGVVLDPGAVAPGRTAASVALASSAGFVLLAGAGQDPAASAGFVTALRAAAPGVVVAVAGDPVADRAVLGVLVDAGIDELCVPVDRLAPARPFELSAATASAERRRPSMKFIAFCIPSAQTRVRASPSSWAVVTPAGIILIDAVFSDSVQDEIVGGMKKVGLDPKDIKYLIVSHAHQDHIGGAEMIQKQFKPRVLMSAPDWELVEKVPKRFTSMAPKRDITATDGMKITLGESTVAITHTPGHTPGTVSYTFPVLDHGRRVNVAYSGGTALVYEYSQPDWGIKNMQTYINSQRHLAAKAKESGATVLLSNHSEFDEAVKKNRMLSGRGNGPHPYEIGADWVARSTTAACAAVSSAPSVRPGRRTLAAAEASVAHAEDIAGALTGVMAVAGAGTTASRATVERAGKATRVSVRMG